MRGRCPQHQLAFGPNGCLLCRREQATAELAAPAAPSTTSSTASAALSSPQEQEPRRVQIRLPLWVLLLPLTALVCYLVASDSNWLAPSAIAFAEPRAEPDNRSVGVQPPIRDER